MLGSGPRAVTALVHAQGVTRVARVFGASCPTSAIDAELAVHDAIRASAEALREHVVAADDLVTLPDGRLALLVEQVAGPSLDTLLGERRGSLALGEAVTLLAPIVQALEAAHGAGVVGLAPRSSSVRLGLDGAPIIVRVHDAAAGPPLPERFRAFEPAYAADAAALERFGAAVAAALPEQDRPGLLAALRLPARGAALAPALFDLAEPVPVRMQRSGARVAHDAASPVEVAEQHASSLVDVAPMPFPAPGSSDRGAHAALGTEGRTGEARLPAWVASILHVVQQIGIPHGLVEAMTSVAQRLVERLGSLVSAIRPRYVVAGLGGAAALVLAVNLVGVGGDSSDAAAPEGVPASSPAIGWQPATPGRIDETAGAGAAGDAPERLLQPEADEWQGLIATLLDRWAECRASRAPADDGAACAARATHAGSAAEQLIAQDDPRHAMIDRWIALPGDAVVVERMGGAVLVDLVAAGTTTASLLVVRSEAGWRIRDVMG